jgi:hypothetical protein
MSTTSTDTFDPFTDPSLRGSYRKGRSARELCLEKHYHHMQAVRQDQWLKDLYARADAMRAEQEAAFQQEMLEQAAKSPTVKRTRQRRKTP